MAWTQSGKLKEWANGQDLVVSLDNGAEGTIKYSDIKGGNVVMNQSIVRLAGRENTSLLAFGGGSKSSWKHHVNVRRAADRKSSAKKMIDVIPTKRELEQMAGGGAGAGAGASKRRKKGDLSLVNMSAAATTTELLLEQKEQGCKGANGPVGAPSKKNEYKKAEHVDSFAIGEVPRKI